MAKQTIRHTPITREQLRRKARFGHREYLYWIGRDGQFCHAIYGRDGIKKAILGVGAAGRFFWFDSSGNSHIARSLSVMLHLWRCAN